MAFNGNLASDNDSDRRSAISPDERRRVALAEIDNAPFSWFHVKVCIVAGVGFFTDAYDIFAIDIAVNMLKFTYGNGSISSWTSTCLKVATPIGNLVGQLLFGWLADLYGRKRLYGVELVIVIIATFCQALSGHSPSVGIIGVLIFWRFVMGVGIGGDYPLSAIISSEFAATRIRGRLMTVVFAFQGWGQFTAAVVGILVLSAFKSEILAAPYPASTPIDYCWRILVGMGCVPGVIALYFRLTVPETPRFTMDIERNVSQAAKDINTVMGIRAGAVDECPVEHVKAPRASRADFIAYFSQWKNLKVIIGTAYSWFALDIAFYGLGLNSSIILTAIKFSPSSFTNTSRSVYESLRNNCIGILILSVAGLIPGYWVSFLFIDTWGRKPIQLMGFTILTVLFLIMGFCYNILNASQSGRHAFVALYCLANFFQNFGPNTTTFIIPGEAFPTRYRSTAHGISAASGKLGAVVAQLAWGGIGKSVKPIMEIFAFIMLTGIFSTLLLPETKQRTLEDISNEEQHSYITSMSLSLNIHT
ncbi:major facilitator superfamily domain-containing protein [Scleroderma yunnanense]